MIMHGVTTVGGVTAGQARHSSSNVGVSLRARLDTTLVLLIHAHESYLDANDSKVNLQ